MLYQLGPVRLDPQGISVDAMRRNGTGGLVAKPVMGGKQPKEATGEGEDDITLVGSFLPSRHDGMKLLETLRAMRKSNARFPVHRGDGYVFESWYAIKELSEEHDEIEGDGVGFIVTVTVVLEQAEMSHADGLNVISGIVNLFETLGL